ncbi:MAG: hypothetical protein AAB016_12410, partial [candidate division NC10 bacterium]
GGDGPLQAEALLRVVLLTTMAASAFEVLFFGLVTVLAQSLLGALVWWNIFIGNLLAAAGMLLYFFRGHRALSRRLTETWPVED